VALTLLPDYVIFEYTELYIFTYMAYDFVVANTNAGYVVFN